MLYARLVEAYGELDTTTKRLEILSALIGLLRATPASTVRRVVHLTRGALHPDFAGVELGLGDKMVVRALAFTTTVGEKKVMEAVVAAGDYGDAAERLMARGSQATITGFGERPKPLTVDDVWSSLDGIARSTGAGSQDRKVELLHRLLARAAPREARYIVRTVMGKLRLGVAEQTLLDALAVAYAPEGTVEPGEDGFPRPPPEVRAAVERAFNVSSDLGAVGEALATKGPSALPSFCLQVGVPVRAMLAERLSEPAEILAKTGGRCALEFKYDGLRLQAHVGRDGIRFFSRRLEDMTDQFPDIATALREAFTKRECILEGECVPVSPDTGEILPFQHVATRRGRKHDLARAIKDAPVQFVAFDCLYLDGADLTGKPLEIRREVLTAALTTGPRVALSRYEVVERVEDIERFFLVAVGEGGEGIMAKALGPGSEYRAGARGWQWIKLKRDYQSALSDTLDLVAVGAFAGRGRRAGWHGALLMACYNPMEGVFETVCKLGTGFDDATLAALTARFAPHRSGGRPANVRAKMEPDVWFEPAVVLEVVGAELTLSPVHTCAEGALKPGTGLAVRFPRFTGRFREDKAPEQATTAAEIVQIYEARLEKRATDRAADGER